MMEIIVKVLLYVVAVFVLSISVHSMTLCSRIFFQNIDEGKMPYKFIEGVFIKQNYNRNNFPVYKRENANLLFYRRTFSTKVLTGDLLLFSLQYFGVVFGARINTSAVSWLATGTLDKTDVFGGLISYWIYWNPRDATVHRVSAPPYIKAVCIDRDFRRCDCDKVYLNSIFTDGKNNITNDANVDYFQREIGTFRNLRPVYKHSRQNWYLQYTSDNYWLVTTTRNPPGYNDRGALMSVNDYALRPEYINSIWSVHYKDWYTKPGLKTRCRGVSSQNNICSTNPCSNGAKCIFTSGNETICACSSGYYGPKCANMKKCSHPKAESTEFGFAYPGNIPGDIAMTFCRFWSHPSLRYAICTNNAFNKPYLVRQGSECRPLYTTQSSYLTTWMPIQPTPSKINFDDMPGLNSAIITCAVLLQILLPFVLWCFAICRIACTEDVKREEDLVRRDQFKVKLASDFKKAGCVRLAQGQDDLDQGVQDDRPAEQESQRETKATQIKRKNRWYRNASLLRLYSLDFYISFFLWLIYLIVCQKTQCTQYGKVCENLNIIAIVMLVICPLFVFIESIFSHELSYLRNIMVNDTALGYIQKMQAVAPVISMTVRCCRYEVLHDEREEVVTHVDKSVFEYGCWVDTSEREMPAISDVALTRLEIDPVIVFGDEETEAAFNRQREEILDRNRHRDIYIDFFSRPNIPGLKKRISAYVDLAVKPWWIGTGYFWLATLLMLTWPYRWLFRAKTGKSNYELKKRIYKSTSPPREVDIMDPIAILQQANIPPAVDQSNVNPSFVMDELPRNATQGVPPAYPGTNQAAYPPNIEPPTYPPVNQGAPYPLTNQGPPFSPANPVAPYPPTNQGLPYPTNQGAPQQMPNIPSPAYDLAVAPTSQSGTASPHPVI